MPQVTVPCANCGAPLARRPSYLKHHANTFCNRACQGEWQKRQPPHRQPRWNGGAKMVQGRCLLHMPWHHMADANGYVFRYVVVAELTLQRRLRPGEVVHHEDEDPANDHPDNLVVFASHAEHSRYHGLRRDPQHMAKMRAARKVARSSDAAE